jgi:ankyrin repeat protein
VELLLKYGAPVNAKVNAKDNYYRNPLLGLNCGATPLNLTASQRSTVIMKLQKMVISGATPLHLAAQQGYKDIVELLLASKATIDAKNSGEATPLHLAAQQGYKDIVELLLASKATYRC